MFHIRRSKLGYCTLPIELVKEITLPKLDTSELVNGLFTNDLFLNILENKRVC